MTKIALIIMSDTESMEALGKVSNAFMLALESIEQADDLKIIFEGAGTKWIGKLEDTSHKLHDLYLAIKPSITGACSFCASAFGVKSELEKAGVSLLSDYKDHPSLRQLVVDGYALISF